MKPPYAVSWSRRGYKSQYTKWHWTENGNFAMCGWRIQTYEYLNIGYDEPKPKTNADRTHVECAECKRKMNV